MFKRKAGFTLIEIVIVVAVIALLAGILAPIAFNQIDDAQKVRALGDCKGIANALLLYRKDTGTWPTTKKMLYTDGAAAASENNFDSASKELLEKSLTDNTPAAIGWRGPYLSAYDADPWGNRYIVEIEGTKASGAPYAWVISAGPDGTFDTDKSDTKLQDDDIGVLLK